jgi:hypothetical protein
MRMKRSVLSVALALAMTSPLYADVTIKATGTGKGMGMSGSMPTVTMIKGMKMRVESGDGDKTMISIYDVENQKLYMFDNKKKEADVWDMAAFSGEVGKAVQIEGMTMSVKPNGQTKVIGGKTAQGFDINAMVPAMIGGEKGMKMTVNMTGKAWIVKGAPGTADYINFYKAAGERGFIFTDPRAAKGSPGQAKAMAEMYEEFSKLGGLPYESETNIKLGGEGPMAGMMAKMGNVTVTSTVESVDTAAIPDSMFAPPAGYKLNQKK